MMNQYKRLGIFRAVILMIIGIILMFGKYKSFHTEHNDQSNQELKQVTSYYNVFFNEKFDALKDVAEDQKVITYFEEVKSDFDIKSHANYDDVHQRIIDLQQSDDDIDYAFVASNHVRSFLSEPYFDAPDYVPSERDWFKNAIIGNDNYISPIYTDAFTGIPIVTLSMPIKLDGVLAMDVNMSKIMDHVSSNGKTCIIQNGEVYDFTTSEHSYIINSTDDFTGLDDISDGIHKVTYKGNTYNLFIKMDPSTGHYLAILDEIAIQNKLLMSSLIQTFMLFFVFSILSVILGISKDNKIRRKQYMEEV